MFASVILDANLDKTLTYSIPDGMNAIPGARVEVTIKGFMRKGYIHSLHSSCDLVKVSPIQKILSEETWITPPIFSLGLWMAEYYATSLSNVFGCMIPPTIRRAIQQKKEVWLTLKITHSEALATIAALRDKAPEQAIALEAIVKVPKGVFLKELFGVSRSAILSLVKKKILESQKIAPDDQFLFDEEYFPTKPKTLTDEQEKTLCKIFEQEGFATHLIYGITGSGKTEIYMQAMQKILDMGKSAIVLVPEVALTAQVIQRFTSRFQERIAIIHHRRSQGERTKDWDAIRKGEARIIIGARSAVFCPAKNLGLIIVDEEHDHSYKQSEESPAYHARDVAIMRGKIENACIVLGSATPSLESYYNAEKGKYILSTLTTRPASAKLPTVRIIDMSVEKEKAGGFTHFSSPLLDALKKRAELGEQTLLFLNRRGYHAAQLCSTCSHIMGCPHCATSLTYHRFKEMLHCHLCDYSCRPYRTCPKCQCETIKYKGFGTEHVEKSLNHLFPHIRTLRMDRDTTSGKHSHEDLITQFRTGKADVLIGTQMIAKGLHFPAVTLVGILNPDGGLSVPDFRSAENVFQLITQVAGRSGRSEIPGEVIIQTFLPKHPTIKLAASQDYISFYTQELASRKQFGYPPFCRLVKLLFTGIDADKTEKEAKCFHSYLKALLPPDYDLFDVLPAGHAKIKDRYRFQFLIRALKIFPLSAAIKNVKQTHPVASGVKLYVDIDPVSTF